MQRGPNGPGLSQPIPRLPDPKRRDQKQADPKRRDQKRADRKRCDRKQADQRRCLPKLVRLKLWTGRRGRHHC